MACMGHNNQEDAEEALMHSRIPSNPQASGCTTTLMRAKTGQTLVSA